MTKKKTPDPKPVKATPSPVTHVYMMLDASGSMSHLQNRALQVMNAQIAEIRQKAIDQEITVTFITFGDQPQLVFSHRSAKAIQDLTTRDYVINGMTSLFSAVGMAAQLHSKLPGVDEPNVASLFITITDGHENNSHNAVPRMDRYSFKKLLDDTQGTGKCTYVFQMSPGTARDFCGTYGVSEDNVREWQGDSGLQTVAVQNTAGLTSYFGGRSMGMTNSQNFYKVETNLKASDKTIKATLTDVSKNFKSWNVEKESRVDEFAELKTKKPIILGSIYYQLVKKEEIQKTKKILVQKIGETAIYGGDEARHMLGLLDDGTAKVTPGKHKDWMIFVESRSINRKLPRGTRVLFDKTMTVSAPPTWDHTVLNSKKS